MFTSVIKFILNKKTVGHLDIYFDPNLDRNVIWLCTKLEIDRKQNRLVKHGFYSIIFL